MRLASHSVDDVDAVLQRKSLAHFVRGGWHVVEPDAPLVWGRHIQAICDHLEAAAPRSMARPHCGSIRRLLINIPPGHMKSLLVSVFWPAWIWLDTPSWRGLFGSYDMGLSTRDSVRCRNVIGSEWYRQTFRPHWRLRGDQNVKTWFENDAGGMRMALSVSQSSKGTGFRGDAVVFDDPLNVKQSPTELELEDAIFWWDKRMSSRFNDPRKSVRVGIMQRLHENDLSGHILRTKKGYEHLCLPTEYDPDRRCRTSLFEDWRTQRGELLFPDMYGPEEIAEAREDLGTYQFSGQHNQDPVPRSGGIIKSYWVRYWYPSRNAPPPVRVVLPDEGDLGGVPLPKGLKSGDVYECPQVRLPQSFDYKVTSSDLAFKDKKTSSFVAMQVWAAVKARRFLLDQIHEHMSFVGSLANFDVLRTRHPGCVAHLIEDKANGPAVMNVLEEDVPDMLPIEPRDFGGSKESRCEAASPAFEAGNVYVPHPQYVDWAQPYVGELTTFPKSRASDRVDSTTQAINWMRKHGAAGRKTEWLARQ